HWRSGTVVPSPSRTTMGGRSIPSGGAATITPAASVAAATSTALVDTRLPSLAGVVDVDSFHLGIELERGRSLLARPDAGGLGAAEGKLRLAPGRAAVDVDDAGLDVVREAEDVRRIAGEDGRGEAVAHVVGGGHRLLEALHPDHGDHRAEDLLLGDAHGGGDAVEHRRLHEVAVGQRALLQLPSVSAQLRSFLLADGDVLEVGLELRPVDGASHVDAGVQTAADLDLLRQRN